MSELLLFRKMEEMEKILQEVKHDALWRPIILKQRSNENARKLKYLSEVICGILLSEQNLEVSDTTKMP